MREVDMPTGRMARALKTTAIATQSGARHLRYLGAKRFSKDRTQLTADYESELGQLVFNGLAQMRGTALKASQMLSWDTGLLPERVRKELAKSCYQVPPINRALIRKVFLQEFNNTPDAMFQSFQPAPFAAASLGQVHKATDREGNPLAVKVQYPGVSHSIESDLQILSVLIKSIGRFSNTLPQPSVIKSAMEEMAQCLQQEVDYYQEAENTRWFAKNLALKGIVIPNVRDEFSSRRILTSEYIAGLHPQDWLATQPEQAERNRIGQRIFNLFLVSTFELHTLHADPHEGNYLIRDDGELALLDFGCVRHISATFAERVRELFSAFTAEDQQRSFAAYCALKLFGPELSFATYESELLPTLAPIQQWMAAPFKKPVFDFSALPPLPIVNHREFAQKASHISGIEGDQGYFDRTFFGVYQLLKKIGAVVHTENPFIYA